MRHPPPAFSTGRASSPPRRPALPNWRGVPAPVLSDRRGGVGAHQATAREVIRRDASGGDGHGRRFGAAAVEDDQGILAGEWLPAAHLARVPLRLRQVYFYLFGTRRSYPACLLDDLAAGPIDASDLGRPPKAFRSDRYARSGANAPAGGNYCDCRRAARPIAAISDQRERGQRVLL